MNGCNSGNKRKNQVQSRRRPRPAIDKAMYTEGIYANPRIVHTGTSLVGCVAQVLVKNGHLYEGIFRTFSPKMDVVLELAHLVEDAGDSPNKIPSKERLVEKIVFNISDIVMITALNVDLDYALKDNFTDTGISKFNGQVTERELQPWEGDGDSPLEALGSGELAENGWDANEMFNTNEEKFNVKSNYDPNLSQYTTKLSKCDTEEYREREAMASRMAQEIEKSPSYQHHANLENGDGDDEELKFSAVVRSNDSNTSDMAASSSSGRYVPPAKRNGQQGRLVPAAGHAPPSRHGQAAKHSNHMGPCPTGPPHGREDMDSAKMNLAKDDRRADGPVRQNHADMVNNVAGGVDKMDPETGAGGKGDMKKMGNPKDRELRELKDFGHNFKLSDNESKEKKQQQLQQLQHGGLGLLPQPENHTKKAEHKDSNMDEVQVVKPFVLNPDAAEFVPKTQPVQTPPRLPSQSPAMMPPQQQQQPPMPSQTVYSHYHMMPVTMAGMPPNGPMMAANSQQQARYPKRAIVSVRPGPDYGQAQAAAAAATGQPLMAQTAIPPTQQTPYTLQYMPPAMMAPSAQGVYPQVMQVPMQGGRIMGPHIQNSLAEQNCVQQMGHPQAPMYMNQPQQAPTGVMPAQMGGPHHPHAIPAHMGGPHPQSHSQPSHMSGGNHPTPSPVQQQQHGGPPQQVSHPPPSSGTPQPQQIIYQTNPLQMTQPPTGHPPLQPSPHTPTSPHSVYPPVSAMFAPQYPYGAPQQGMPPPQGLQPPNMGHPHQQQYVMMQSHPPGQNPQQQPQQQQQQQIQLQHMHHMQQQASLANQGGPPMVPPQGGMNAVASSGNVQQQMAYIPHHQMQSHPLGIQGFHQGQ